MPREQQYYTVELKNAAIAGCRARDVRLNGQPLTSVRALVGPGKLQFVTEPKNHIGGRVFGSLIGSQVELNIAEAGQPGEQRAIHGRVSAVTPGPAAGMEEVTMTYQKITWSW